MAKKKKKKAAESAPIPSTFDPARFREAEEASMAGFPETPTAPVVDEQTQRAAIEAQAPAPKPKLTGAERAAATIAEIRKNAADVAAAREAAKPTEDPGEGFAWVFNIRENKWKRVATGGFGGGGTGGGGTGSTGGGITPTGLTKADVDKAVAEALAAQQAKFDALTKEQAAEREAAKMATRTKAKDKLTAMLSAWNLQGLASWIDSQVMNDVSEEMIFINLYDQKEYKQRFPGMEALRKAGRTISEDEYIRTENAMIQTARFFDLPKGFYDSPEDFGKLIGNQVSAKEYQDRLQVGQDLARTLNPSVKQQLIDFYGVGEGDLTAFVLDSDRALPLIQKQAKAAMFVGLGRAAGFTLGGVGARQAEAIAGTESYAKLSEAQLKQALGQAGELRREQQRLSQVEGMTYNEQEALDAVIESNPQALLASQQRAQREVSRFSARGGLTGASLRGTETAI